MDDLGVYPYFWKHPYILYIYIYIPGTCECPLFWGETTLQKKAELPIKTGVIWVPGIYSSHVVGWRVPHPKNGVANHVFISLAHFHLNHFLVLFYAEIC